MNEPFDDLPRIWTICPDFLRPFSDQLDAGQYVLYSEYLKVRADAWAALHDQKLQCEARVTGLMQEIEKYKAWAAADSDEHVHTWIGIGDRCGPMVTHECECGAVLSKRE